MGRILVGGMRVAALVLCAGVVGLWVRSDRGGDTVTIVGGSAGVEMVSARSGLGVETYQGWPGMRVWRWTRGEGRLREAVEAGATWHHEERARAWAGFALGAGETTLTRSGGTVRVGHRWVRVPHGYAAGVLGLLAIGPVLVRARRASRGR